VAYRDQINIRPAFKQSQVPCEGEVGDLFVMTPLAEHDPDPSPPHLGKASLWFCTEAAVENKQPAIWQRVKLDEYARCGMPIPDPPENLPPAHQG